MHIKILSIFRLTSRSFAFSMKEGITLQKHLENLDIEVSEECLDLMCKEIK